MKPTPCPCHSGTNYSTCCQRWHTGSREQPPPVQLMRSRYAAYALQLEDYLLATWHPDTRPARLGLTEDAPTKWIGLRILRDEVQGDSAIVEFEARYKINGKAEKLYEISRFIKLNGDWYYLDASGE
ncbi:YchJ family protein [Methylovorus menthalis]|uniref:YchJ family protein n=1 Tax=Methylovorus menthalis TaxID=1002227 RepID=UPI001E5C3D78|nr:YchJ family protein [Methylovorus menthalis]MCB4810873.1 YchJ family protein [Methylovorus menthalis]